MELVGLLSRPFILGVDEGLTRVPANLPGADHRRPTSYQLALNCAGAFSIRRQLAAILAIVCVSGKISSSRPADRRRVAFPHPPAC